jgi:hypothetical protein
MNQPVGNRTSWPKAERQALAMVAQHQKELNQKLCRFDRALARKDVTKVQHFQWKSRAVKVYNNLKTKKNSYIVYKKVCDREDYEEAVILVKALEVASENYPIARGAKRLACSPKDSSLQTLTHN